ncbi:Ppx/GppA phosphatase family protein [Helicovermis profundi]|uniref:Ppx/GppA phosphatase family protein n=1 Tax=Helicovermis profundi TaxID=3065157 RepID=A0AAU9E9H9_9FIRM|nr:Ppx/GppA phosphatase family protein [Clostridia bacterium S502]
MEKGNSNHKYAVIDIGSNSVRLLCAKVKNQKIVDSYKKLSMTRMGYKVNETKLLSTKSMELSYKAIKEYYKNLLKDNYKLVDIIATSAVRDSLNKSEFVNMFQNIGLNINIISGKEEARLGYLGVLSGIEINNKNILIIDIGGGSTEFIVGNSSEILFSESIDMGAVRFSEKYIELEIPSLREINNLEEDILDKINNIYGKIMEFNPEICFGIGGTITTMGAIDLSMENYDSNLIHNYNLKLENLNKQIEKLSKITLEEKYKIRGLQPKRADIIFAGSKILYLILKQFNFNKITISDYDNLEGILKDRGLIV